MLLFQHRHPESRKSGKDNFNINRGFDVVYPELAEGLSLTISKLIIINLFLSRHLLNSSLMIVNFQLARDLVLLFAAVLYVVWVAG